LKVALPTSFEPNWSGPREWAAMYRACGIQVVPAHMPNPGDWKFPKLTKWKTFQDELVPDSQFERWYGPAGEYSNHQNMGLLTGRASGNVFVIDLDEYKDNGARQWWSGVLAVHNNGMEIETCQQLTGGGGRQLFYRARHDWTAPTNRTPIGVDIRGQGGFAMMPPSLHVSGKTYDWKDGYAPWECEIAEAPEWLLEAVVDLVKKYGGEVSQRAPAERREHSGEDLNAFGLRVDGREDYMTKLVWGAVTNWYRECPIPPTEAESQNRMREAWSVYARKNKTRVPGVDNIAGLEQEGRGPSLFAEKWRRAVSKWSDEIAAAAALPTGNDNWRGVEEVADAPPLNPDKPLILSSAEFVAGFRPPEYLIDGVIQQSYLYSLTARTGHGKTAIGMFMAQAVARGQAFHGHETKQGSVLFLAGENPDDVRARYLVLADHHGFNPAATPVHFIDGVVDIAACLPRIREEAAKIPDLALVIVDTAAAYFRGDDGNSNTQQAEFARLLRQLTFLPGKPACVVPCHPIKNASKDNLAPVGGGAFLNEVDGNLTIWSNAEKQASLHWQGKFRGPEFEPMPFEMRVVESDRVTDANGVVMPSVVAVPISDLAVERTEAAQESDENLIMKIIAASPRASLRMIAEQAKFSKSKVERIFHRLVEDKMLSKHRAKYRLTEKGKKELGINDDDD
jgi:hypothetical protein